jgi:hypothetical protein
VAKGDEAKALQLFDTWCDGDKVDHPKRFMQRWVPQPNLRNKAGQGRTPKITQQDAKRLATIYKRGFVTAGEKRGFRSIAHAKKKSKEFATIISRCQNPTDETVRNAIKKHDPNFAKVRQTAKKTLTDDNKKKRRQAADKNIRRGMQRLRAVTFIDEFSLTAELPNTKVAGDRRKGDIVINDRFQTKKHHNRPTVCAIIAVNYAKGPLYIEWLTGTTGGVGKTYTVSCQLGCLWLRGQLWEYVISLWCGWSKQNCTASKT